MSAKKIFEIKVGKPLTSTDKKKLEKKITEEFTKQLKKNFKLR